MEIYFSRFKSGNWKVENNEKRKRTSKRLLSNVILELKNHIFQYKSTAICVTELRFLDVLF